MPGSKPDMLLADSVTADHIRAAAERLDGIANRTPIHTSRTINQLTGAEVFFKCENFQRIGAFKFRGAYNALSKLSDEQRSRGVLTYSSGNHAQAVALSSSLLGIRAVIVMPSDAPRVKLSATRGYLGKKSELLQYDKHEITREELGAKIANEQGLTIIPPYDHPDVIAGQGTVALELFEDVGELDRLYVCVGGGGLLSGCAVIAKAECPVCRVIGVEPELANDACRSFSDGLLHTVSNPETIADGARTPSLGRYTFPLVMQNVDEMMDVSDSNIIETMRLVWERMKLVIEPTGALALSGLLKHARDAEGLRIGVVISGGNVDLASLSSIFDGA